MENLDSLPEHDLHDAAPALISNPEHTSTASPTAAAPGISAIALTDEQQARLNLLNEYQEHTHAPREVRDAAFDTRPFGLRSSAWLRGCACQVAAFVSSNRIGRAGSMDLPCSSRR